jgi:hypothetical protein
MLKLFQALFGERAGGGSAYPDSLVEAVIDRAVDATDPRLRALGNHRRRLREPALATIEHVMQLVDSLPAPVEVCAESYREDAGLRAMFASLERLHEVLGRDAAVTAARAAAPLAGRLYGLLVTDLSEKHVLGLDLEGDRVKRDVQQTVLSFDGHRVADPGPDETQVQRALKLRAFDHILAQVLEAMGERKAARQQLGNQRELLRRKLATLQNAGFSFNAPTPDAAAPDSAELERRLAAIEAELEALGPDAATLEAHLQMLSEALAEPAARLRVVPRTLHLDHRNVLRADTDLQARTIAVQELQDGRGARVVVRPLAIDPALLPRTDFMRATQRYA